MMENGIILENETNELGFLEFEVSGNSYGINVAKIREITACQRVTAMPGAHPFIEGVFMPRDVMITVIDLKLCLQKEASSEEGFFIITNFNHLDIAFHVDKVKGIRRVSWSQIIRPELAVSSEESISTGVVKLEERLIVILDFEKIVMDINPENGLKLMELEGLKDRERNQVPILIADDSILLNRMIVESLMKAGYVNLIHTCDGQEAWNVICKYREEGTLKEHVQCVITDLEMPIMDGYRLLELIREDELTRDIPVIIFSALVNEEMRKKAESLGASAQLSKPDIGKLVETVDRFAAQREADWKNEEKGKQEEV